MKADMTLIPVLGLCASMHAGAATNMFDATVSGTKVIDGNSVTINGSLHDTNGNAQPWTAQVYAQHNECLRLFVTSTKFDAKLVVITPDNAVYRDDDSGGSARPLIKIGTAPNFGWYTVQVAQFNGQPLTSDFTLKYGRYKNGADFNPNCADPSTPVVQDAAVRKAPVVLPAEPHNPYAP